MLEGSHSKRPRLAQQPGARGPFGLLPGALPSRPMAKACGPVARPGPARCRRRPIKGRQLGFGDPNRPLCRAAAAVGCSGRRRRHPPTSPGHRRRQAAVQTPSLLASKPPIPLPLPPLMASTRPGHGGRPAEQGRPSPASFGP